jgi:ABC-type transport system involved in multi-copper enzyme maturation permease subunit
MMRLAGVVAVNTFREAVRDRVLYSLLFFALLMIAAAILVGQISIGIETLVIINLGLSAISMIGLLMAVFIGVGLVYKEMDKRTLYALLSKPIRRWEFLVGKFAGLLLTLAVNTALMTVGLAAALFYVKHSFDRADATILLAVYFILLKLALITALALLFSCFSTPLLSILFTVGLYVAGLFASDIRTFGHITGSRMLDAIAVAFSYLIPNFNNFNITASAAYGRAIPGKLVLDNTLYAAVYAAIVLLAASAAFSRRNLK